jgi:site-specific DNA-methyltransferase (adenine-specific)
MTTPEEVFETDAGRLIRGDCRIQAENIRAGSADLVLTDPPYGTIRGADLDRWDHTTTDWDMAIPPDELIGVARRLLRKKGKAVFFSQEPYTSELITSRPQDLPFSYRMVWEKDTFANSLIAKTAPVKEHEDLVVFTKEHDTNQTHPLREYFAAVFEYIDATKTEILDRVGGRADHTFRVESPQFSLCTCETYDALVDTFGIDAMDGFKSYDELARIDEEYKQSVPNVFNLPEGEKYKSDVLEYPKPHTGDHPTQKPVPLLSDLIRTFTHEGDLVVDLTAGSGSTAVAAEKTGREFVAIEKDPDYFQTAARRLQDTDGVESHGQQKLTTLSL